MKIFLCNMAQTKRKQGLINKRFLLNLKDMKLFKKLWGLSLSKTVLPSYKEYKDILISGIELLKEEREKGSLGRKNGVHILDKISAKNLIVIGDIHGDFSSLTYIINNFDKVNDFFIALGDYIDRGSAKAQVLSLFTLLKLKIENAQKVILLRGNHEPPKGLEPYPHDYPSMLNKLYGQEKGKELYELSRAFFDEMPYAIIIKGLALFLHGGPPTSGLNNNEDQYLGYSKWPPDLYVLEEVLWNDPRDNIDLWAPSPRGAGKLWGKRITEKVLKKIDVKYIIRGHEPAPYGYKVNHGGKVLTLFSRLGEPYSNIKASYILCNNVMMLRENPLKCIKSFS